MKTKVVAPGQHNENLWRQEFREAYLWLFPSFANDVNSCNNVKHLIIKPNPVENQITLGLPVNVKIQQVEITDNSGRTVMQNGSLTGNRINVSELAVGEYFIRITTKEDKYLSRFVKK